MYRFLVGFACFSIVSSMNRQDVVYNMNALLYSQGWRTMVVYVKDHATNSVVPSRALQEPLTPEPPVTERNVDAKLRLMSVVLSCKYAEIVWWYVGLVELMLSECGRPTRRAGAETCLPLLQTVLCKINNTRPLLMRMFSAVAFVNHMDVTVTVSKFEDDLWKLITHMDALYEDYKFLLEQTPETAAAAATAASLGLLNETFETFRTTFVNYVFEVVEFVDGFCVLQFLPTRENITLYYRQSLTLIGQEMGLSDFLSTVLDNSIPENIKHYYDNLAFHYDAATHKTTALSIASQLLLMHGS